MRISFSLFAVSCLITCSVRAMSLQYIGETTVATGARYEKSVIGGLSAIVWQNNTLYALSDDKGHDGEPRFYEFDLKIDKKIALIPKAVHFIVGLPEEQGRRALLDPEGLVRLPNGDFLIASEGSGDAKPRVMPRIFRISESGRWKSDLPIPEKYLPEPVGQQTKGVQNNLAFEGLTSLAEGKVIFASTEAPLMQDLVLSQKDKGSFIRIIKFKDQGSYSYKPSEEYAYRVDDLKSNSQGPELIRGVSEILALSENKILVLERGVRLQKKGWSITASLYLADLTKATNTLDMKTLSGAIFQPAAKEKLLDFETDLTQVRAGKSVQNFEALSWGPLLPDGRRSLLVMVDNNFSKRERTELVVFSVEGESL